MSEVRAGSRIYDSDSGHCQVAWRSIYICNTIAQASSANINSLVRHLDTFAARRHDRPIVFLLLTQAGTSPPAASDRKRVVDILSKHAERIGGVGISLGAEGFSGAVIRSVASAVFLLPRTRYEVRFFSRPAESAPWAAKLAGCFPQDVLELIRLAQEGIAATALAR